MSRILSKWLLPLVAVGLLVFAVAHVVKAEQSPPKPPPPIDPARTPFGNTVAGSGIVEAVNQNVSIGASIPGLVEKVFVPVEHVGQVVKKGDPLFLIDSRQLKSQLRYQVASLKAAEAQLTKLKLQPRKEELPPKQAAVAVAQAQVEMQSDLASRARQLVASRAMSTEDATQRVLSLQVARRQLAQATRDLELLEAGAWKPDIDIAQSQVDLAGAMIEQTRTDLERLMVRAPKDGVVLQVNVREGEYVGLPPTQALVVLGDINKRVHVRVDIDEHDIIRFKKEAPAQASVRGAPQIKLPLKYRRVEPYVIPKKSLTGDNTERVDTRVLQVVYELDTSKTPIYVGQQLDVFIDVGSVAPAEVQRSKADLDLLGNSSTTRG